MVAPLPPSVAAPSPTHMCGTAMWSLCPTNPVSYPIPMVVPLPPSVSAPTPTHVADTQGQSPWVVFPSQRLPPCRRGGENPAQILPWSCSAPTPPHAATAPQQLTRTPTAMWMPPGILDPTHLRYDHPCLSVAQSRHSLPSAHSPAAASCGSSAGCLGPIMAPVHVWPASSRGAFSPWWWSAPSVSTQGASSPRSPFARTCTQPCRPPPAISRTSSPSVTTATGIAQRLLVSASLYDCGFMTTAYLRWFYMTPA
jgi:hypothetical protein